MKSANTHGFELNIGHAANTNVKTSMRPAKKLLAATLAAGRRACPSARAVLRRVEGGGES
jgi:hypothetical protein